LVYNNTINCRINCQANSAEGWGNVFKNKGFRDVDGGCDGADSGETASERWSDPRWGLVTLATPDKKTAACEQGRFLKLCAFCAEAG